MRRTDLEACNRDDDVKLKIMDARNGFRVHITFSEGPDTYYYDISMGGDVERSTPEETLAEMLRLVDLVHRQTEDNG